MTLSCTQDWGKELLHFFELYKNIWVIILVITENIWVIILVITWVILSCTEGWGKDVCLVPGELNEIYW